MAVTLTEDEMALRKKSDTERPKTVTIEIEVTDIPNLNQIATSLTKYGNVRHVSYSERGLLF